MRSRLRFAVRHNQVFELLVLNGHRHGIGEVRRTADGRFQISDCVGRQAVFLTSKFRQQWADFRANLSHRWLPIPQHRFVDSRHTGGLPHCRHHCGKGPVRPPATAGIQRYRP